MELTNDQINRMLAVNFMGDCWHKPANKKPYKDECTGKDEYLCELCRHYYFSNPDYINEVGFFQLLERAKEQEWWEDFIERIALYDRYEGWYQSNVDYLLENINYKTFPRLLCEFGMEVKGWE